jgi:DNA-directed RNA polymerase specialized sigma24 family protein
MAKNGTFQKSKVIQLCRADIERLADQWITGRNAERDREIIKRRLIDGITYERLAEIFDLSDRQIKNIVYKRQEAIYKHVPI